MPETVVTPAQLRWTGGTVSTTPLRIDITGASLRWSGGFVLAGPGTGTALTVTTPKLDRLMRQERIVEANGAPSQRFQSIWQSTMQAIEAAFSALTQQVGDNTILLNEIRAAMQLAQAANDTAAAVQSQANLSNSYVEPTGIISASSDGTITIAAHTRVYGDTSVSVDAGSISGFAEGAYVQIFYDDAARAGGAVSYQGTTDLVAQEGARHIVGGVSIPTAGQPPQPGNEPPPPGYVPRETTDQPL